MSVYQKNLPKLHENTFKNYRLKLFKKIAIGYNHGFHMFSESPISLSNGLHIYSDKYNRYPCLQFIFGSERSFAGLLLKHAPLIIIKMIIQFK